MGSKKQAKASATSCPCGHGDFEQCCKPYLDGVKLAPTAEALMRSRYSAYSLARTEYVLRTWHHSTRPSDLNLDEDAQQGEWIGLTVKQHTQSDDTHAEVEFVARYKPKGGGPAQRMHERSRFVKEEGQWFYIHGETL
jgi:SEC-C motif-containing protein